VLSFLSNTRVYLAAGATDLRKSFDTLAGVVRESLRLDPLSGHLFVFTNSRKNRIKILFAYSDANRTPIRFEVGQRSDSKRTAFRLKPDSRPG
jgi:transposase